jgi:hypothetical protein
MFGWFLFDFFERRTQIKSINYEKSKWKNKTEKISIYYLGPHLGNQSSIFHQLLDQFVKDKVRNYNKSQPLWKSELQRFQYRRKVWNAYFCILDQFYLKLTSESRLRTDGRLHWLVVQPVYFMVFDNVVDQSVEWWGWPHVRKVSRWVQNFSIVNSMLWQNYPLSSVYGSYLRIATLSA